ncbi:Pleiotropic drug resistance protein [Thalictrum thalictroides]|uniref:Pleiotropic drug resistance protein n=1 Tax=Thalictrum thalictroides TaxID=46969 RepID=A0A7J6V063_THATH|nr:Pleiotropic drug resistance protein [Thalictrum thalictroides]
MTVRETLDFSTWCQDVLAELVRREKLQAITPVQDIEILMKAATIEGQRSSIVTDYILKLLGLDLCANTMVGEGMK